MESKHVGRVFGLSDPDLCNVVKTSTDDETVVATYSGNGTIEDFLEFLEDENITPIVEWERPRHWPKGRP
jgi:hypothetical protein